MRRQLKNRELINQNSKHSYCQIMGISNMFLNNQFGYDGRF
jgi:hypothetical protein